MSEFYVEKIIEIRHEDGFKYVVSKADSLEDGKYFTLRVTYYQLKDDVWEQRGNSLEMPSFKVTHLIDALKDFTEK